MTNPAHSINRQSQSGGNMQLAIRTNGDDSTINRFTKLVACLSDSTHADDYGQVVYTFANTAHFNTAMAAWTALVKDLDAATLSATNGDDLTYDGINKDGGDYYVIDNRKYTVVYIDTVAHLTSDYTY